MSDEKDSFESNYSAEYRWISTQCDLGLPNQNCPPPSLHRERQAGSHCLLAPSNCIHTGQNSTRKTCETYRPPVGKIHLLSEALCKFICEIITLDRTVHYETPTKLINTTSDQIKLNHSRKIINQSLRNIKYIPPSDHGFIHQQVMTLTASNATTYTSPQAPTSNWSPTFAGATLN